VIALPSPTINQIIEEAKEKEIKSVKLSKHQFNGIDFVEENLCRKREQLSSPK
jgi:hypothetical protein